MRRFIPVLVVLMAGACLVAAGAAYVAKQNTPARWMGWRPDPHVGAPPATAGGTRPKPTIDEVLGFSRYLPEDTDTYLSVLQGGRVCRALGDSRAWRRITDDPPIRKALGEFDGWLHSDKIPPEGRTAIELLSATFDSEIAFATTPETSRRLLALGQAGILSFALFAPAAFPADSPPGQALEEKRAPMREEWAAALKEVRIPPFVIAARVRDEARFNAFVQEMLDRGWQNALGALPAGTPPAVRAAVEGAYGRVTIGGARLLRLRVRVGDLIPEGELARGLKEIPATEPQRAALAAAIQGLTLEVHLGFLGEYLTLAVSSDDHLIRAIVDRYEGRAKGTLAASAAFERIRAELTPDAGGLTFSDGAASRAAIQRSLLPLLNRVTDPELLGLFGAPPQIAVMAKRLRLNLETAFLSGPVRVEQVSTLDRGVRQFARMEYEKDPPAEPAKPLGVPAMTPADAIGYYAVRWGSFEGLWDYVRFFIEQQQDAIAAAKAQAADNPQLAEVIARQEALLLGILAPIDKKLSPSMQGELGLVVGSFTPLAVHGDPDSPLQIRDIPIPTGAILVRSPAPDQAIEGFRDLLRGIMAAVGPPQINPFAQPPVSLRKKDLDGTETWLLTVTGFSADGLEPHLAKLGDFLVLSTSFQLTKQIRDAAAGKAPAIATASGCQSMRDLLPAAAREVSFMDGGALNRNLRSTSDALFAFFQKSREPLRFSARDLEEMAVVKKYVELGLDVCGCFRGQASATLREGRVDTLREWIHVEDLEAK